MKTSGSDLVQDSASLAIDLGDDSGDGAKLGAVDLRANCSEILRISERLEGFATHALNVLDKEEADLQQFVVQLVGRAVRRGCTLNCAPATNLREGFFQIRNVFADFFQRTR